MTQYELQALVHGLPKDHPGRLRLVGFRFQQAKLRHALGDLMRDIRRQIGLQLELAARLVNIADDLRNKSLMFRQARVEMPQATGMLQQVVAVRSRETHGNASE